MRKLLSSVEVVPDAVQGVRYNRKPLDDYLAVGYALTEWLMLRAVAVR